jgi:hypothetical protein
VTDEIGNERDERKGEEMGRKKAEKKTMSRKGERGEKGRIQHRRSAGGQSFLRIHGPHIGGRGRESEE